jgi:hypothetical protein
MTSNDVQLELVSLLADPYSQIGREPPDSSGRAKMTAPYPRQRTVRLCVHEGDRGEIGALVLMSLALVGWVAAALSFGGGRMWIFGALASGLTLAAMALMRPAPIERS